MVDLKLTNPCNTPDTKKTPGESRSSYDYRQDVIQCWIDVGVPLRPAEVAGIDFRSSIAFGQKHNLTPKKVAQMLHSEVKRIYTNKKNKWHYQQKAIQITEQN